MKPENPLTIPVQKNILLIRGHRVMLDFDLAALYRVENRSLKQAVRRNIGRFPEDFMFELNKKEVADLLSQNVIPPVDHNWVDDRLPWFETTDLLPRHPKNTPAPDA